MIRALGKLRTNIRTIQQLSKDIAVLEDLYDPHIIRHAAGERGIESAKNALMGAYTTFPDLRFVVEDVLVEGDKAALRLTIHGVPQQPLPIIMEIFHVENGRIVEVWGAGTLR